MQAVILAAGRGTRMGDLTETVPKPMLKVSGKTLLEHKFEILPDDVTEIIIIIGYMGDVIRATYGATYKGKKITYIEQDILDGTAGALWRAKEILTGKFLVMMGDDLYSRADIDEICKYEWAELVQTVHDTRGGGATIVDANGTITDIQEGTHSGSWIIGTNMFVLDTRLFDCGMVPKSVGSHEFGLPQSIVPAARELGIAFKAVDAKLWIQVTSPEDLALAEKALSGATK